MEVEKAEILFVSTANTGLSEIAEGFGRERLSRAGLAGRYRLHSAVLPITPERPGPPADYGHPGWCYDLRCQPLTQEKVAQADLVIAMSERERQAISQDFIGAKGRTFLLSRMAGDARDISDLAAPSRETLERRRRMVKPIIDAGFQRILEQAETTRAATMARVGLATVLFALEPVPPTLPETLSLFKRAGVPLVEWTCDDMEDDRVYTPEQMERLAALLEANDLKCELAHGFESSRFNAVAEGQALDRYVAVQANRIELCARLGGDTVVIHIPGIFCGVWDRRGLPMQDAMEQSTAALDRLRPLCERLGITLALENSSVLKYERDLERLEFYFSRYPASFITFCLEVGNANIHGPDALEGLKAYASRLSGLHLHDNRPVEGKRENDHQPPFSGTIDWIGFLGWLQEIGYARSLNFELVYKRLLFPGNPPEFLAHAVRRIRQALNLVPCLARGSG